VRPHVQSWRKRAEKPIIAITMTMLAARARWMVTLALVGCTPSTRVGTPELELHGADVWTYSTQLEGYATRDGLTRCAFEVDGAVHEASLAARRFSARLDVAPEHDSAVRARCVDSRGSTLYSPTVTLRGRASAAPTARASVHPEERALSLDARASTPNPATRAALVAFTWTHDGEALGDASELRVPRQDGAYELRVRDARGREDVSRVMIAQGRVVERASWLAGGTVYGVIPPLFGQAPLAGVREKLDELRELGVRALWLSPVFRSPPGDFGYAVTDYFHVREEYGGDAELAALVQQAHARGLRVLLDLVINHSSAEHPYYREAQALGARSHYYRFYDRDAAGSATHYFDWAQLPNYNFAEPEVVAWTLAFSRYWLARGIDGYRVDAAWGVRQRAPEYYAGWVQELRRVRSDAFLLAEAPASDPYYREHGFDAGYDWTEELGHHAWEHVFDAQPGIAERLASAVARAPTSFHFLNNNDTGERFITRHGPALTRVATVALLTLPGIPCVYSFDEVGAAYQPYQEDAPHDFHPELRALHRELIALRRDAPALQGDVYQFVIAQGDLLVFRRGTGPEQLTVAINFGAQPVRVELARPFTLEAFAYRISGSP
jgi:cyclomaltodextrinase